MQTPKPVITPVKLLLQSRKTIVALATALANILVLALPSLEPVRTELVSIFTILGTVLIYAIMKEDVAEKSAPTNVTTGSAEMVNVNQPPQQPTPLPDPPPTMLFKNDQRRN